MGAVFFAGLMVILCVLAGIFFLLGSILLIISIVKNRKGKKVRGLRIVTVISYFISVIFFAVPIGWFGFLRTANQQTFEGYVDTGVYIRHDSYNVNSSEQFYFNDDLYIAVDDELQGFRIEFGQSVANAKGGGNALLDKIFNYNSESTIYEVKNNSGYTILSGGNASYCRKFYKKEDSDKILNYYHSLAEYEYYYADLNSDGSVEYKAMGFDNEVFDKLLGAYETGEMASVTDEHAIVYSINQTSPDGVYWRSVDVVLKENDAYVLSSSGGGTHSGYRLDESTAAFVKSAVGYQPD